MLDGPHFAVIATSNADGRPQSSVIFVKRDGDTVVFSTIKGRLKTRNMVRDPRVSLLVVDKEKGRYVEIRVNVEITEDPDKRLLYEMYDLYMQCQGYEHHRSCDERRAGCDTPSPGTHARQTPTPCVSRARRTDLPRICRLGDRNEAKARLCRLLGAATGRGNSLRCGGHQ